MNVQQLAEKAEQLAKSGSDVNDIVSAIMAEGYEDKETATAVASMLVQKYRPAPVAVAASVDPFDELIEEEKQTPIAPTSQFQQIALAALARGEGRVLPIMVAGKNPEIKWKGTAIDTASEAEWVALAPAWIEELAAKHPNVNVAVIAKPFEKLFIDEDASREFRAGYEAWSGEKFPETYATSARENRLQSHWLQTDKTRGLGNIPQGGATANISVRQHNLYVLAEGSEHKNGVDIYKSVGGSTILSMPDKLVEYIESIRVKNEANGEVSKEIARGEDGLVPVGSIHNFMLREAGRLRGLGLSAEAIYPALRELVEKNCQVPPGGFDDSKIVAMSKSIENFPEGRPTELLFTQQPADANAPWPQLIPLNDALSPVPALNIEWLPEAVRPWIVDVAERMSVPVDFTAVAALCALAGVTGRRVFVFPKANDKEWRESICIPGAVVAASGKKKTPTWKPFMNPLNEIEAEWVEQHNKKVAVYKEQAKAWLAEKKQCDKEGKAITTLPPEQPKPCKRLLINDATYEIIQDILKDNPQGILYFRDELSGWAAEMDREGREGQRQFFLSLMNGDDRNTVDRITRDGGSAILCGTVFGSFQPELLRAFLFESKTIEEGTVPRFHMLVWPDEGARVRVDRPANTMAKDTYRRIVRQLAVMKPESLFFHFDAEAQQLFYQFQDRNTAKIESEPNLGKQSHLSKYEGAIAKIAALFQLVDLITAAKLVPVQTVSFDKPTETKSVPEDIAGHHTIDAKHFQMAEAFLGYLEAHMHRVYDSQRNDVQQVMDLIAGKLRKGELRNGFTVRYLQRKHWVEQAQTAEFALDELEENGWVRKMPKPTGPGQHATRYEANPDIRALG